MGSGGGAWRRHRRNDKDTFKLDRTADAATNALLVLRAVVADRRQPMSDAKRVSYLFALVELLDEGSPLGFTVEELLCCMRLNAVHESSRVRAAALRAIRYTIKTPEHVALFNVLRLPYLVARSLDLVLGNEMERVQALKVVRRVLRVDALHADESMIRALVASPEERDRMMRAYLAALCELAVLNPPLFIHAAGVSAITRAVLDCQTPRIAESLCGVLVFLLNEPATRRPAKVDLRCLAAPYCDFHYRHGSMDKNRDEREMRFTCSRLALLSILRSWSGLLHFCDPRNESGLSAIVHVLYLNQLEVRKAILDLLYDLLGLPLPDWTDELAVALSAVDPSEYQDSWRLKDGFVAAEGKSILPHLSVTGPNLAELHLALLLYCFLEVGLLDALVEVMITSDTFISVRTTVLLGQLLHLIHLLLPPETCNLSPALPTLLSKASATHPQAMAAVAALQNLNSLLKSRPASRSLFLDNVLQCCNPALDVVVEDDRKSPKRVVKARPDSTKRPYIYQMEGIELLNEDDYEKEIAQRRSIGSRPEVEKQNDSVLIKSKSVSDRTSSVNKIVKTKLLNLFDNFKYGDSLMKDSSVFQNDIGIGWDWNIIRAVLKNGSWHDEKKPLFVDRLVNYFKPSSNRFSHADLQPNNCPNTRYQAIAAIELVNYLLTVQETSAVKLLKDLFSDIQLHVAAITSGKGPHDCLFSPQHMTNTMCQMYFLLIGRLCSVKEGLQIFKDTGLYESLLRLSVTTHHICYVKLIVSSLNYMINSYPRQILTQTLQCDYESARLYATQFLNVLLRARQNSGEINKKLSPPFTNLGNDEAQSSGDINFSKTSTSMNFGQQECPEMDAWLLELLVKQTRDTSKAVSLCALSILDEACNVPMYLDKLISMKPAVKDLGDKGYLLWIRFASTPNGFQSLAAYIPRHIKCWVTQYNYKYTKLVEGDVHDCLTLLQRSEDGRYSKRNSSTRTVSCRGAPLLPHFYGQLVLHQEGVSMLAQYADIPKLLQIIKYGACSTEQEITDLKAAIWACGHIGTSSAGIDLLLSKNSLKDSVFSDMINLAQNCNVYSIRGTAFFVLGLVGCSYMGANLLYELGWLCVRHNRHERWPIIKQENWLSKSNSENQIFKTLSEQLNGVDQRVVLDMDTSEHSDKLEHSNKSDITNLIKAPGSTATSSDSQHPDDCKCLDEIDRKDKYNLRSISESSDLDDIDEYHIPGQCPHSKSHHRSFSESKTLIFKRDEDIDNSVEVSNMSTPIVETRLDSRHLIGRHNSFELSLPYSSNKRNRNNSESSTSGVSSCDSVLGKYILNERILTLSPIPSSSSLSAMKSSLPLSFKRKFDMSQASSVQSYTAACSPPSQRDLFGYATIRSLSLHRRPTYSDIGMDDFNSMLEQDTKESSFNSLKGKFKLSSNKNSRSSLFKYDWRPITSGLFSRSSSVSKYSDREHISMASNLKSYISNYNSSYNPTNMPTGPCYIGISMPRSLLAIFPNKNVCLSEETSEMNFITGDDSLAMEYENSIYQDAVNRKNDDSNFNSSFSDISTGNEIKPSTKIGRTKSRDRFIKHDQLMCLYCSRSKPVIEIRKNSDLREAFFAGMDSPKPSFSSSMKSNVFGKSPAPASSLTYVSLDISCGSPTSLESNLSKLSDGNPNVLGEILRHSIKMGNPVLQKQSRQTLLTLKQKYPEAFQSVCLYSEICKIISQNTYRLNARRFLQELFLDLNFESFYIETQQILQSKYSEQDTS